MSNSTNKAPLPLLGVLDLQLVRQGKSYQRAQQAAAHALGGPERKRQLEEAAVSAGLVVDELRTARDLVQGLLVGAWQLAANAERDPGGVSAVLSVDLDALELLVKAAGFEPLKA